MKYEKVPNANEEFKNFSNQFKNTIIYKSFKEFHNFLVSDNPLVKFDNKTTAFDYQNYMKKIFYLIYSTNIENLENEPLEKFIKKIHIFKNDEKFKDYNIREKRFPNSAINYYIIFFNEKLIRINDHIENVLDENDSIDISISDNIESNINYYLNGYPVYKRNKNLTEKAIKTSLYRCAMDNKHVSFIKDDLTQYLEGHHLIPIGHQMWFDTSLDVIDNIVPLCPNCHKKIHYGNTRDKEKMITVLYGQRKALLEQNNIEIELKDLLKMY